MLWRAGTGVCTIVALLILIIAPDSLIARFVGGGIVLLVVAGVIVFYIGLREGHRIGVETTVEDAVPAVLRE
jgi:hypothetical protein